MIERNNNMNIVVFDTETTSLEKPFCYNIGYIIADATTKQILLKRDYVVEQIWHNLPLFSSAYYANKRKLYVSAMRGKRAILEKFGYICRQMSRDFSALNVEYAYAFNSPFDDKVFSFNCDWFKCNNPFDTIPILDIRGYAHNFLVNNQYKEFCEEYKCDINLVPYIVYDESLSADRNTIFKTLKYVDTIITGYTERYIKNFDLPQDKLLYKFRDGKFMFCSSNHAECGHSENFKRYSTKGTCFVCDLKEIFNI